MLNYLQLTIKKLSMKQVLLIVLTIAGFLISNAQPPAGLVGYWPMDGNFTDLGPYAIHGTNNAATVTTNSG